MQTKKCTKCGEEKELNEFYKDKIRRDKHRVYCKKCEAPYYKKYYIRNLEKLNAQRKKYQVHSRTKLNTQARKYWSRNRKILTLQQRVREAQKREYLTNDYIKRLICQNASLNFADIPIELVALKREQLKLTRLIRQRSA